MVICDLPPYEVIDLRHPKTHAILRGPIKPLSFPLSKEDERDIDIVERRFDTEENMAGVAAPQIGIAKQIIVFAAVDPEIKKWRQDFTQSMPKQVWLNPSFDPIGDATHEEYEGCFSVEDMAGPVKRYSRIKYWANDRDGNVVKGIAEGYLARVIQHEVEHIRGTLFIDHVAKGKLLPIEEYREKRRKAMQES